jgi:thymidine kinase
VKDDVHEPERSTRDLAVYNGLVAPPVDSLYRLTSMVGALWGEIRGPFDTSGPRGCVEVVCGSMFSGKTEELLRRVKRAKIARLPVQLFKPTVDARYDAVKVVSHAGGHAEALPVASAAELEANLSEHTRVVGIDEVQFFDDAIVAAVDRIADRGVRVICAGLDLDYRGLPFGSMPALLAIAEQVTKLQAVCSQCGAPATRSQRLVAREGQLFVGGASEYEPRCRACFLPMAIVPVDG